MCPPSAMPGGQSQTCPSARNLISIYFSSRSRYLFEFAVAHLINFLMTPPLPPLLGKLDFQLHNIACYPLHAYAACYYYESVTIDGPTPRTSLEPPQTRLGHAANRSQPVHCHQVLLLHQLSLLSGMVSDCSTSSGSTVAAENQEDKHQSIRIQDTIAQPPLNILSGCKLAEKDEKQHEIP